MAHHSDQSILELNPASWMTIPPLGATTLNYRVVARSAQDADGTMSVSVTMSGDRRFYILGSDE